MSRAEGKGIKGGKVGVGSEGIGEGNRGSDAREGRERVRKKEAGLRRKQVVEAKIEVRARRERSERKRERRQRREG